MWNYLSDMPPQWLATTLAVIHVDGFHVQFLGNRDTVKVVVSGIFLALFAPDDATTNI